MTHPGPERRSALWAIGALALAGLVVALALANWLMAVAFASTVFSMTLLLRDARREDRAHRAEFAARIERARQPPTGPDA